MTYRKKVPSPSPIDWNGYSLDEYDDEPHHSKDGFVFHHVGNKRYKKGWYVCGSPTGSSWTKFLGPYFTRDHAYTVFMMTKP